MWLRGITLTEQGQLDEGIGHLQQGLDAIGGGA